MVIGYDPIAGTIDIDLENGSAQVTVPIARLIVKYYGNLGILFADLSSDSVQVGLIESEGEHAGLTVERGLEGFWNVQF